MTVLNFFEQLLVRAHRCHEVGRRAEALALLGRLGRFADLPQPLAEKVRDRLGVWHLKRRHFRKARRHLLAALALDPDNPRRHRLLGLCLAADPTGDLDRAWRHYRRVLSLAPNHTRWRAEAGLVAVRLGRVDEGLLLLRQAHEQAPDDPRILGKLVKGLGLAGQPDEAVRLVRLARFRAPRCPRLGRLWFDLRLAEARRVQQTAAAGVENEPVLLPFPDPSGAEVAGGMRYDGAHALPGPHLVRLRGRRGCRRAP